MFDFILYLYTYKKCKVAKDFIIEQLKKEFKDREIFTRDELYQFFNKFEIDLKETTFRWRVFELKEKRIITPLSRGLFSFDYKPLYRPSIEETEKRLFDKIYKQFPNLKLCIWSTRIINEFMLHQPGRFVTILEVESNAIEPVFHYLKDINVRYVFLQPNEMEIDRYVFEADSAIILQTLISKAPIQRINKITTLTIEKLIVDIFSDKILFSAFQGSELNNIINNAYHHYAINFTKLFSYARRRGKEEDLMEYLSQQTDIPQSIFND